MSEKFTGETPRQVSDGLRFLRWLNKHKREENTKEVPKDILRMSKKYGWLFSGKVYRGIKWSAWSKDDNNNPFGDIEIGKYVTLSPETDSWTISRKTAQMFIVSNGSIGHLPRNTVFLYSKEFGRAGVVLEAVIENGLSIPMAIEDLEKSKNETIYNAVGDLPMFGDEGEILGIINSAKISDEIDWRKLSVEDWKRLKEWQDSDNDVRGEYEDEVREYEKGRKVPKGIAYV